jgi:hypothetical protein
VSIRMTRMCVSFSGGETSGYMAQWLLANAKMVYGVDDLRFVFANTGQENEQTLEFVDRCDRHFGLGVVWVEAEIHEGEKKAPTSYITNFYDADRTGRVFEAAVAKYGVPNSSFPHCTRSLKLNPIQHYMRTLGWGQPGDYLTAVGIRADEADRVSASAAARGIAYPLVSRHPMRKPDINTWWAKQPFRLELRGYQGNCKWCWKKSFRKHFTLLAEDTKPYEFPARMERDYGRVGPEFRAGTARYERRHLFRGGKSTADLFLDFLDRPDDFVPAHDDAVVFAPDLDVSAGCGESCEVYADGDDEVFG